MEHNAYYIYKHILNSINTKDDMNYFLSDNQNNYTKKCNLHTSKHNISTNKINCLCPSNLQDPSKAGFCDGVPQSSAPEQINSMGKSSSRTTEINISHKKDCPNNIFALKEEQQLIHDLKNTQTTSVEDVKNTSRLVSSKTNELLSDPKQILNTDHYNKIKKILSTMEYSLDNNCISDIKFIELIDTITNEKYKEDIYAILENKIQFNTVQKKSLDRIIKNKPNQKLDIYDNSKKKDNTENKNCPHCGHINTSYKDNAYIVCGYTNKGYDLEGCANDWCFGCGKRLCKNWMTHDLFMITNRFHNGKCCKKHAEDNGLEYGNSYCNCTNSYVNRKY